MSKTRTQPTAKKQPACTSYRDLRYSGRSEDKRTLYFEASSTRHRTLRYEVSYHLDTAQTTCNCPAGRRACSHRDHAQFAALVHVKRQKTQSMTDDALAQWQRVTLAELTAPHLYEQDPAPEVSRARVALVARLTAIFEERESRRTREQVRAAGLAAIDELFGEVA